LAVLERGHVRVALADREVALDGEALGLERLSVDLGDDLVRVVRLGAHDDRVGRGAAAVERVGAAAGAEGEDGGRGGRDEGGASGGAHVSAFLRAVPGPGGEWVGAAARSRSEERRVERVESAEGADSE